MIFPLMEKILPRFTKQRYIKLFFSPMKYPFKGVEKKAINESKIWTLRSGNKNINLYKWGNGPKKALFVHGWSGRGAQGYKFVESFLTKDYTFFAFDLPAHGHSTGKQTNIFEATAIVREITETFGSFECVIGHSFGGIVATYAMVQKLPFRKLILIGSPHSNAFIVEEFALTLGISSRFRDNLYQYVLKRWDLSFDDLSIHKMIEDLNPRDVLIVHDRNDKEVPFELTDLVTTKNGSINLVVTEGLGHKRILESIQVIDTVLEFSEK